MQRVLCIGVFHFAPPFYGKTKCVLIQNVFHFATKRVPFPYKTPPVLGQNTFQNFRDLNL